MNELLKQEKLVKRELQYQPQAEQAKVISLEHHQGAKEALVVDLEVVDVSIKISQFFDQ